MSIKIYRLFSYTGNSVRCCLFIDKDSYHSYNFLFVFDFESLFNFTEGSIFSFQVCCVNKQGLCHMHLASFEKINQTLIGAIFSNCVQKL